MQQPELWAKFMLFLNKGNPRVHVLRTNDIKSRLNTTVKLCKYPENLFAGCSRALQVRWQGIRRGTESVSDTHLDAR